MLIPDFVTMTTMVEIEWFIPLVGLPQTIEMIAGVEFETQGVVPIRPRQPAFRDLLEKRLPVEGRIAQMKGIAGRLEQQLAALDLDGLGSLFDRSPRAGRPQPSRDRVRADG